jgi:broad specificity phosphatase PhoE
MPQLDIEAGLAEQSFGDWHGLPYADLARLHGESHQFWLVPPHKRPPNGESFADLYDRTAETVLRLNRHHAGRNIVATAHGGTIRAALGLALGLDHEQAVRFEIGNVSLTCIEHFETADPAHAWRVVCTNLLPQFTDAGSKA